MRIVLFPCFVSVCLATSRAPGIVAGRDASPPSFGEQNWNTVRQTQGGEVQGAESFLKRLSLGLGDIKAAAEARQAKQRKTVKLAAPIKPHTPRPPSSPPPKNRSPRRHHRRHHHQESSQTNKSSTSSTSSGAPGTPYAELPPRLRGFLDNEIRIKKNNNSAAIMRMAKIVHKADYDLVQDTPAMKNTMAFWIAHMKEPEYTETGKHAGSDLMCKAKDCDSSLCGGLLTKPFHLDNRIEEKWEPSTYEGTVWSKLDCFDEGELLDDNPLIEGFNEWFSLKQASKSSEKKTTASSGPTEVMKKFYVLKNDKARFNISILLSKHLAPGLWPCLTAALAGVGSRCPADDDLEEGHYRAIVEIAEWARKEGGSSPTPQENANKLKAALASGEVSEEQIERMDLFFATVFFDIPDAQQRAAVLEEGFKIDEQAEILKDGFTIFKKGVRETQESASLEDWLRVIMASVNRINSHKKQKDLRKVLPLSTLQKTAEFRGVGKHASVSQKKTLLDFLVNEIKTQGASAEGDRRTRLEAMLNLHKSMPHLQAVASLSLQTLSKTLSTWKQKLEIAECLGLNGLPHIQKIVRKWRGLVSSVEKLEGPCQQEQTRAYKNFGVHGDPKLETPLFLGLLSFTEDVRHIAARG
uniref:FH2 domain-containing protein n=1 Tax=Chromera velia CCMP2878 TaxID=1169474 RepID=A0A0G4GLB2_9ALVE|eukprot:Cvel_689.t1-p1 / transcript=Cvel_689.t1 / gene=Cvel_689 / organism=Chromera_velia_CCMP2878 / gene_product=hypothetical protein / transcript_product=hypothetical protein / location=Cvel_scaffold21:105735-110586(+) / protein_length=637 / sequence_SO=supercontig / SO=protein_coding / is_pseudo=false